MANQTDIDMQDAEYEDGEQENENEQNNDNEANVAEMAKESSESTDDMLVSSAEEKEKLRLAMAAEVEAFLSRGGKIQEVGVNVMADPPRKPQTSYGSRPI
jgi:orotidine-5'-phosphate decarboxylase